MCARWGHPDCGGFLGATLSGPRGCLWQAAGWMIGMQVIGVQVGRLHNCLVLGVTGPAGRARSAAQVLEALPKCTKLDLFP